MVNKFDFNDGEVKIVMPNGAKIAIFDVSRTIECLFVAVSADHGEWLLERFREIDDMLEYVAKREIKGATVTDDGMLENFVTGDGYDSWKDYVNEIHAKSEPAEFPVYIDAQGNEHAEY